MYSLYILLTLNVIFFRWHVELCYILGGQQKNTEQPQPLCSFCVILNHHISQIHAAETQLRSLPHCSALLFFCLNPTTWSCHAAVTMTSSLTGFPPTKTSCVTWYKQPKLRRVGVEGCYHDFEAIVLYPQTPKSFIPSGWTDWYKSIKSSMLMLLWGQTLNDKKKNPLKFTVSFSGPLMALNPQMFFVLFF